MKITSLSRPTGVLVLACSATKRPDLGRIPAIKRYDCPLRHTLRATDHECRTTRVGFLPARFCRRDAVKPIADYDARPAEQFVAQMIAGNVTTWWRWRPHTVGMLATAMNRSLVSFYNLRRRAMSLKRLSAA